MITSLRLSNFKCFEELDLPMGPLTLLSGLNSSGKSSVLQALLLLRQSHQQSLLEKVGLALNGELVSLGTASDTLYQEAEEDRIAFEMELDEGPKARWSFQYDQTSDVLSLDPSETPPGTPRSSLFNDDFQYLAAERLGPRPSFGISDFGVRLHRQVGIRGEHAAHYLVHFGAQSIKEPLLHHPQAVSDSLKHQVEAWLGELSPGIRLDLTPEYGMDLVNLRYIFGKPGGPIGKSFRTTNAGFGLTYTLAIIVAVLAANPGALLLIENPEAHLHPRGQSIVAQLLARSAASGVQILVETHSDHVLNGVRVAVHQGLLAPDRALIHFFQRQESGKVEVLSPRVDRSGRLDSWPEDFFDEWDKSLEKLLEPIKE